MFSFYVELERRSGNPTHEHHPRLYHPDSAPVPIRLLTEQQKENTKNVMDATTDKASSIFLLETTGRYFDTIKLTYLDRKMKGPNKSGDDIDSMIKNFELSNEIKFTTLSDIPVSDIKGLDTINTNSDTITIFTTKSINGNILNDSIEDDPIMSPISENAKATCLSKKNYQGTISFHFHSLDYSSSISILQTLS